jgi:hypothetical protein
MKNYELYSLADQISKNLESLKYLKGAKFTYSIIKNIELIEKEIETLGKMSKPSEEFENYDKERLALCEKLSQKDGEGNSVKRDLGNGNYEFVIDVNSKEWIDGSNDLRIKYESTIKNREVQINNYNEILNKEVELNFFNIKLDDIPNDVTLELMNILKAFIKE